MAAAPAARAAAPPVVVITGASAGVGRAVAAAYAGRGARLALLARGRAGLEAARAEAEQLGAGKVVAIPTDVADAEAVEAAAQQAEAELGALDVWVNNAVVSVFAPVLEVTPTEYRRVMDVIFGGYVHGTQAALRRMLPRDRGRIVQVGSALAYRGIPAQSAYCAAKHAVQGFNDSLRAELHHAGSAVTVSSVHMPALNTPQFGWVRTRLPNHPQPVPPIFTPQLAARAVLWAADHGVREINVGAPTIFARYADAVAPGLLDRYLGRGGIRSQQTDEPVDHDRWHDNLDAPVDDQRDYGADGDFGDRAKDASAAFWAVTHKPLLAAAAAGLALLGASLRRR